MSIPIRITTKIECGASYRYGEDGPDGEVYRAWLYAHADHLEGK